MRLIDADYLVERIERCERQTNTNSYREALIQLRDVKALISVMPTIDPVRHGRWERHYSRPGVYANLFWYCSVCSEACGYSNAYMFERCPYCGAKMDEGEEDA